MRQPVPNPKARRRDGLGVWLLTGFFLLIASMFVTSLLIALAYVVVSANRHILSRLLLFVVIGVALYCFLGSKTYARLMSTETAKTRDWSDDADEENSDEVDSTTEQGRKDD